MYIDANRLLVGWIGSLLALLLLLPASARAQGCCTPGSSPIGGVTGGPTHAGSIEIGVSTAWFELKHAYRQSVRVEDPGRRTSRVISSSFFLRVGLGSRWLALLQVPYDVRRRRQVLDTPSGSYEYEFRNSKLGDTSVMVLGRVWPSSGVGPTAVNVGVGLKLPTGPDDAEQDGLTIPFELQTGTGSYDPLAAVSAFHLLPWGPSHLRSR